MPNLESAFKAVLSYHEVLVKYEGVLITEWEFEANGNLHMPYPIYPEPINVFISSVTNLVQRWTPKIGDYQDVTSFRANDRRRRRRLARGEVARCRLRDVAGLHRRRHGGLWLWHRNIGFARSMALQGA